MTPILSSDRAWNDYLRKFKGRFFLYRERETGIWSMLHKFGNVQPHTVDGLFLNAYVQKHTKQGLTYFLASPPDFVNISQLGETEAVIIFPIDKITEIRLWLGIYTRRPPKGARIWSILRENGGEANGTNKTFRKRAAGKDQGSREAFCPNDRKKKEKIGT